jgi:hypothetical protein
MTADISNTQLKKIERENQSLKDRLAHREETIVELQAQLDVKLAEPLSDGFHTMDELYHYRMLYNAQACLGWISRGIGVAKSLRHNDGELCFGGGWFIVTAQLPTGQVSNHYKVEYWDLFPVLDVPKAPKWDGHTPEEAARRLEADMASFIGKKIR